MALTVSIVSHGHDDWLPGLLQQLAKTARNVITHVIVTHNLRPVRSVQSEGWPFVLKERCNSHPLGFGANHNRAFAHVSTPFFCVLNPDVSFLDEMVWERSVLRVAAAGVGCAFPTLVDANGSRQDNVRSLLTPFSLLRRHVWRKTDREPRIWASAACWVMPSDIYARMDGFDERYFMYCEDADFCMRLQLDGLHIVRVDSPMMHEAQRASRRRLDHMAWHVCSLLHLWTSKTFWRCLWRRKELKPLS
ncbi:glycosyl transferase [Ramlibacter sp. H39-3-26]|nr:glycosyl transferase [Ramlibacter sp. H39-3-26]